MNIRYWLNILQENEGDNHTKLARLLLAVRNKIVSGRASVYGDCELVAEDFLAFARGEGLVAFDTDRPTCGEGEIVLGWRAYEPDWCMKYKGYVPEPGQHQWVEIAGMIYDGTADQFGDRKTDVVIVPASDPRYRVHSRQSCTFMKSKPFPDNY